MNKIEQSKTIDYAKLMKFEPLAGHQILRETLTDAYVFDETTQMDIVNELDALCTELSSKTGGVVGALTLTYTKMVLFHVLGSYDNCKTAVSELRKITDELKSFVFTGNFKGTRFTNITLGEELKDTEDILKYAEDTYNTAVLVHKRAASYESGFSLIVASILYHFTFNDIGAISDDIKHMHMLLDAIDSYIDKKIENPEYISDTVKGCVVIKEPSTDTEYASIEEIVK